MFLWTWWKTCSSIIMTDVLPRWHCVNSHLNAPEQQTIRILWTSADDQSTSSRWPKLTLLNPEDAGSVFILNNCFESTFQMSNFNGLLYNKIKTFLLWRFNVRVLFQFQNDVSADTWFMSYNPVFMRVFFFSFIKLVSVCLCCDSERVW